MATNGGVPFALLGLSVLVFIGLSAPGLSFKQQLILNLVNGTTLTFEENVANLTEFRSYLPLAESGCGVGVWRTFVNINYTTHANSFGYVNSATSDCKPVNATGWSSLRHWAASETTTNAISLYTETYQAGDEILVTGQVYGGIKTPIKSFSATGNASWTLFEGQNLDGNSACVEVPHESGYNFDWAYTLAEVNLTTIGSVVRGCED